MWSNARTNNVVLPGPYIYVDGVQDSEEREPPADAVNDDLLSALKELVDDSSEQQKMNERPRDNEQESPQEVDSTVPDEECPGSRGHICLLASVVDVRRPSNGVHVGAQEEEVDYDVDDLHKDPHS